MLRGASRRAGGAVRTRAHEGGDPLCSPSRKGQKTLLDWHSRVARSYIGTDIVDPSTGEILKQVHNLFIERPDPPPLKPRFSATLGSAETGRNHYTSVVSDALFSRRSAAARGRSRTSSAPRSRQVLISCLPVFRAVGASSSAVPFRIGRCRDGANRRRPRSSQIHPVRILSHALQCRALFSLFSRHHLKLTFR